MKHEVVNIDSIIANENVVEISLKEEIEMSMISYSLLTIIMRALPDVRDGMKPVQRRILYCCKEFGYDYDKSFIKNAKISGDVSGNYHPHGSCYLTIVNMAQPWSYRYPLIAFQGNCGSLDGDSPGADRYCVTGDTLVSTNKGLLKIEDIAQTELNSECDIDIMVDSIGGTNKAVKLFNSGLQPVLKIKNELGIEIICTPNHPLMVLTENNEMVWKIAEEITEDDCLVVNCKENQLESDVDLVTETEAKKLANNNCKEIPKEILQSSRKIQAMYLSQWFESNSNVEENVGIYANVRSNCFLRQVQTVLLNMEIISIVDEEMIYIKDEKSLVYFQKEINFISEHKKESLLNLISKLSDNEWNLLGFTFSKIKSIENAGYRVVYSPKVDSECHSFTANGLINHNTEAKLAKISNMLLEDVMDKSSVPFQDNYSETKKEPKILPGLFPNFLLNGATGIAVGYTTKTPSHNLNELCDAIVYAINHDDYTIDDLMKYVKGPDFPCGAIMLNSEIKSLYETGIGKLTFRAHYVIEENEENKNPQIVFVDLPPESDKPKLLEKIHELISTKVLPRTIAVRDESTGMNVRIVIECQKTANILLLVEDLYSKTNLQKNCSFIMRGVLDTELKLITLTDYMDIYLEHRKSVIRNRTNYLLESAKKKLNIQLGLNKVIGDIKTAINIIIDCDDSSVAKATLIEKYNLANEQAEYILDKKVRSLVKLDRDKILNLIKDLEESISTYESILNDEKVLKDLMIHQTLELKKQYGDERRTEIVDTFEGITIEAEPKSKEVYVVLNKNSSVFVYDVEDFEKYIDKGIYKDKNNIFVQYLKCKRTDDLIIINKNGICERVSVTDLQYNNMKYPDAVNFIKYDLESEKVLVSVFKDCSVKKTYINKMKFKKNKPILLAKDTTTEIVYNKVVNDLREEIITVATGHGCIGRFSVNSFMATAMGAKAMSCNKLEENDYIIDCKISLENQDLTNKIMLIFNRNDDTIGYKVMNLSEILVKGRSARAITYITGKKFKDLICIAISENSFSLMNDKNKQFVINKFEIVKRSDKGFDFDKSVIRNELVIE